MIKKAIFATGAAVGLMSLMGLFCFGTDTCSYVTTSVDKVKGAVRDNVPISFEIERARKMIGELTPDIRQNMHVIAEEEVEIKKLNERIAKTENELARQKEQIMTMKNDLSSQRDVFTYANRKYTANQVKAELASRFDRYKTQDATLASLQQIRSAREKSLSAARAKLDGMFAAKRQLEVDVENLEAQLKLVEAAQTTANYNFDDSRLSRVKELVEGLRTRLEVTRRLVDAEDHFASQIELDDVPADLDSQITDYFSNGTAEAGSLATTAKVEE